MAIAGGGLVVVAEVETATGVVVCKGKGESKVGPPRKFITLENLLLSHPKRSPDNKWSHQSTARHTWKWL